MIYSGSKWSEIPKIGPVIEQEFNIPSDIKRESSFTTMKVLKDGMNSHLRSSNILEKLRQMRLMEEKKKYDKGILSNKCPKQPLSDIDEELVKNDIDPVTDLSINIDEYKPTADVFKHIPLSELPIIPKIKILEGAKQELNRRRKVEFKI